MANNPAFGSIIRARSQASGSYRDDDETKLSVPSKVQTLALECRPISDTDIPVRAIRERKRSRSKRSRMNWRNRIVHQTEKLMNRRHKSTRAAQSSSDNDRTTLSSERSLRHAERRHACRLEKLAKEQKDRWNSLPAHNNTEDLKFIEDLQVRFKSHLKVFNIALPTAQAQERRYCKRTRRNNTARRSENLTVPKHPSGINATVLNPSNSRRLGEGKLASDGIINDHDKRFDLNGNTPNIKSEPDSLNHSLGDSNHYLCKGSQICKREPIKNHMLARTVYENPRDTLSEYPTLAEPLLQYKQQTSDLASRLDQAMASRLEDIDVKQLISARGKDSRWLMSGAVIQRFSNEYGNTPTLRENSHSLRQDRRKSTSATMKIPSWSSENSTCNGEYLHQSEVQFLSHAPRARKENEHHDEGQVQDPFRTTGVDANSWCGDGRNIVALPTIRPSPTTKTKKARWLCEPKKPMFIHAEKTPVPSSSKRRNPFRVPAARPRPLRAGGPGAPMFDCRQPSPSSKRSGTSGVGPTTNTCKNGNGTLNGTLISSEWRGKSTTPIPAPKLPHMYSPPQVEYPNLPPAALTPLISPGVQHSNCRPQKYNNALLSNHNAMDTSKAAPGELGSQSQRITVH
ncbi:hypothetical protein BX600DRAFT_535266 [Xylariales sp. PMI_506]|nr:hypothetical protein BX600DRAFT_535266 [Xylariales sp. PMI_506]